MIAALTIVIACTYTLAAPAVDKTNIADVRAAASGFAMSMMLVMGTLLVVVLRKGYDEPLIVPTALLQSSIPILVAPVFALPLFFRAWRKRPDRP